MLQATTGWKVALSRQQETPLTLLPVLVEGCRPTGTIEWDKGLARGAP